MIPEPLVDSRIGMQFPTRGHHKMAVRGSVLCGVFFCAFLVSGTAVANGSWVASRIAVNPRTGLPTQIVARRIQGGNVFNAPATLMLGEQGKEFSVQKARRLAPGQYLIDQPDPDLRMELRYGAAGLPYVDWVVTGKSGAAKGNLTATFVLAVRPSADHVFFPAANRPRFVLAQSASATTYSYGGSGTPTAMPLGQVYSPRGNWGLAFFSRLGEDTERMSTTLSRTRKSVRIQVTLHMRYPVSDTRIRRLYFVVTRGDWRPALGAVLKRFPKVFKPHSLSVATLQGPFVDSTGTPPDALIRDWYGQGARVVEIHGTFPFYGRYVSLHKVWTPLIDDRWHRLKARVPLGHRPPDSAPWQEIRRFVQERIPPIMTVAKVNNYIHRLHQHGMKGLIYFNPTEAWAPWVATRFPQDRILTASGQPVPAWYESVEMRLDIHNAWGRYLLNQIRGQLREYPRVDGIFFDQAVTGGRRMTAFCAAACQIVRAQGKICWWNGPYTVPLAELADGMMTEGGGSPAYRQWTKIVQYYGLAGKPIVSLGPATDSAYAEMLVHGVIPKPVSRAQHLMGKRWFPLFSWLRNRSWVLSAHALDTTPGVKANLFRLPNGDLVVPVVRKPATTVQHGPLFDVGVTVRTGDIAKVRAAYFLTPDLLGYHKLPLVREGHAVHITIPTLGVAGLLVLAKTGIFAALDGTMTLVRGHRQDLRWTVDNWTTTPKKVFLAVNKPLGRKNISGVIGSDSTKSLTVPVTIPKDDERNHLRIVALTKIDGKMQTNEAALWIDSPLLLTAELPPQVRNNTTCLLVVRLLGHIETAGTFMIRVGSLAWRFEDPVRYAVVKPNVPLTLTFTGHPMTTGRTVIRIIAAGGHQESTGIDVPVEVLGTTLSPGAFGTIRSAELLLDTFGVDGGPYANKPVYLNGFELGDLPQGTGDQWTTGTTIPLTPDAIRSLRPHNEITIDNRVGDAFKIRNIRLRLHMQSGETVVSTVDARVFTGGTGWLYGEGKQFPLGQPLTGIPVDIPVRANHPR